jgi:hypothetical protein
VDNNFLIAVAIHLVKLETQRSYHQLTFIELALSERTEQGTCVLIAEFRTTKLFESDQTLSQLASLLLTGGDVGHNSL